MMALPGGRVETNSRGRAGGKLRDSFYAVILVMIRNMDLSKLIELLCFTVWKLRFNKKLDHQPKYCYKEKANPAS